VPTPPCPRSIFAVPHSRGGARAANVAALTAPVLGAGVKLTVGRAAVRSGARPVVAPAVSGDTRVAYGPRLATFGTELA